MCRERDLGTTGHASREEDTAQVDVWFGARFYEAPSDFSSSSVFLDCLEFTVGKLVVPWCVAWGGHIIKKMQTYFKSNVCMTALCVSTRYSQ